MAPLGLSKQRSRHGIGNTRAHQSKSHSINSRWSTHVSPSLYIGGFLISSVVGIALVSLLWTPFGSTAISTSHELLGPSNVHLLGTDEYGRDIFSRIMAGTQISLYSSLIAVLIAAGIGIPAGLAAAISGKYLAELIMRMADLLYAFPTLLAAITLVAALGASTTTASIAIGIASIPGFARVTRAGALSVLSSEYVLAAKAYGRTNSAILRRHVIPNISAVLIVQVSLIFSTTILAVAALSYLGLGTPPPTATWGGMLEESQGYLSSDPWLMLWPGLAIALSVLGFNLLGDGLRDLTDPTLRSTR